MSVPKALRPAQSLAARQAIETRIFRVLDRAFSAFLADVQAYAESAYLGPVLLAAPAPRDERGRFSGRDPFAFTNVLSRWYEAIREIEADPALADTDVLRLLDEANIPTQLFADVAEVLSVARAEDASPAAVKRRLSKVLVPKQAKGSDRGKYRSRIEGIARAAATELHNRRMLQRMKDDDWTYGLWVSRRDALVRLTHVEADGQTQPLGSPYRVGLAMLRYPGDPLGPPEETYGCRCVLAAHDNPTLVAGGAMNQHENPTQAEAPETSATDMTDADESLTSRLTQFASLTDLRDREAQDEDSDEDCGCDGEADDDGADGEDGEAEILDLDAGTSSLTADGGDTFGSGPMGLDVRWEGVLAIEGTPTGDGRLLAPGSLTWGTLPLAARYVDQDVGAHDNAVVVGKIETIERRAGGVIWGTGSLSAETDDGVKAIGKLQREEQRGVSVDLDSVSFEVRVAQSLLQDDVAEELLPDHDGRVKVGEMNADDQLTVFTSARIRAATIVATPAFEEARISVVEPALEPALTASAFSSAPQRAWFEDPRLDKPTGLTVTPEGRVFGHIAAWGTCHIGFSQCVTPPHSASGYSFFHVSALEVEGETLAVGKLTVDTGHADVKLDPRSTARHYDNTGATAAFVRAGEDAHGIWVAGVVSPDATPKQIRALRTSPQSGDWRTIRGNLELVASLGVNVPGFPIPRPQGFVASGGEQTALVAAGMVPPAKVIPAGKEGALSEEDLGYLRDLAAREKKRQAEVRLETLAARAHKAAPTVKLDAEGGE